MGEESYQTGILGAGSLSQELPAAHLAATVPASAWGRMCGTPHPPVGNLPWDPLLACPWAAWGFRSWGMGSAVFSLVLLPSTRNSWHSLGPDHY